MRALALAAALIVATPTDAAACHRFRVWRFPHPQRCEAPMKIDYRKPPAEAPKPATATAPKWEPWVKHIDTYLSPTTLHELQLKLRVPGGLEPDDILLSRAAAIDAD